MLTDAEILARHSECTWQSCVPARDCQMDAMTSLLSECSRADILKASRPLADEVNPQTLKAMQQENVKLERYVSMLEATIRDTHQRPSIGRLEPSRTFALLRAKAGLDDVNKVRSDGDGEGDNDG